VPARASVYFCACSQHGPAASCAALSAMSCAVFLYLSVRLPPRKVTTQQAWSIHFVRAFGARLRSTMAAEQGPSFLFYMPIGPRVSYWFQLWQMPQAQGRWSRIWGRPCLGLPRRHAGGIVQKFPILHANTTKGILLVSIMADATGTGPMV
jgi:hypothetical protein